MKLGLGLGLGVSKSAALDWANYDGSNDGDTATMFNPIRGGMASVALDSARLLAVYQYGNPSLDFRASIITRSGKAADESDEVVIDNSESTYGFPTIGKLSDTRYIVSCTEGTTATHFWLLNLSGNTITVVDKATLSATAPVQQGSSTMAVHSSSLIMVPFVDGATLDLWLLSVSISGDTLTVNGITEVRNGISFSNDIAAITALTATTGIVSAENLLTYYTISGTTPTAGDTERLNASDVDTKLQRRQGLKRISDTSAIIVWRDETEVAMYGKIVSVSGGTLSSGTSIRLSTADVFAGGYPSDIDELKDGYYIVASKLATNDTGVVIVSVDGTTLTKINEDIKFSKGEHVLARAFTGGDYALFTVQNGIGTFTNDYAVITP